MKVTYYFADFMIQEICLAYADYIRNKHSNEIATQNTINEYKEIINQTNFQGYFSWIALAYYQWELGRLLPHIKQKAIQSYQAIRNNLAEFYTYDVYHNYVDRSKVPTVSHDELLNQSHQLISQINLPMPQPKQLRRPKICNKIKGFVNYGVYAYELKCSAFNLEGTKCYIYFLYDSLQSNNASTIYIYNMYTIDEIANIDQVQENPVMPSNYYYANDVHNLGMFSSIFPIPSNYKRNYEFKWNISSLNLKKAFSLTKFIGVGMKILLPKEEFCFRCNNMRNSFVSALFENLEKAFMLRLIGYKKCELDFFVDGKILIDKELPDFDCYEL